MTVIATSSIRNRSCGLETTKKREKQRTKQFYRNLIVGNLEIQVDQERLLVLSLGQKAKCHRSSKNVIKRTFGCALYRVNVLHVTAKPQVVEYRAVYVDWKLRNTGEKHAGRSILSYKLDLEAANLEQTHTHTHTHTQSKYCNPRAHARRALTSEEQGGRSNLSYKHQ